MGDISLTTDALILQTDSRLYQLDLVSSGTTPNQAWIFQWATSALSPAGAGYAMLQQFMYNDEASWLPSANGIFTDVRGDYNWGHHVNVHDQADNGVGFVVGVHSSTGLGQLIAIDHNSAVGTRYYAYAPSASSTQNIIEFYGRRNPLVGGTQGQFTGDWMEAFDDGTSVFRVNYQGSAFFGGASGTPILTLGRGAAGVDYDFLKVDAETSDLTMSWLEDEKFLKFNATSDRIGMVFGNPSTQLFTALSDLATANVNAAGLSSGEDCLLFLEAKDDAILGGAVFAGVFNPDQTLINGNILATFAGAGNCNGDLPTAASVTMLADGDWDTDDSPAKIVFSTQPSGATDSLVTRMSIFNDGRVAVGSGAASSLLDVDGDVEISSTAAVYFGDPSTDGSWRITRSGSNLLFQRRASGSWSTIETFSPP